MNVWKSKRLLTAFPELTHGFVSSFGCNHPGDPDPPSTSVRIIPEGCPFRSLNSIYDNRSKARSFSENGIRPFSHHPLIPHRNLRGPRLPGLFTKPDLVAGKAAGAKTYSCTSSPDNAASVKSRRAQRVRDFAVRIGVLLETESPS